MHFLLGKKLNLELYNTQYDPAAGVYSLPAFCMMFIVSSFWLGKTSHGQEDGFHGIRFDSSKEKCDIIVFPKKWEFSGDISFIEPYMLFRVVVNTNYTVIVPGWSWHNLSFNLRWRVHFFLGQFQDRTAQKYQNVAHVTLMFFICCMSLLCTAPCAALLPSPHWGIH